jgi:type I restriction enzyme R subunit
MPTADEIAIVHAAVGALKDIRLRADFEVYLKLFLASLDIVLPHAAAQPFRVPAKRFGYLLRMAKERYKDDSIQLGDAGEKVRQLINEHLISLGIDPKVPPIELFADDFLEKVAGHAQGNAEAKASEMEHAIRRHCTVHLDEDPAFYKRLSEKLEQVLERHRHNWDELSEELAGLRQEALAGRREPVAGLDREASTFYEHLASLAFGQVEPPAEHREPMKALMRQIIELLQETIGIIDFWNKAGEQKRLRGRLSDAMLFSGIQPISDQRERLAVEVLKLAKNRHQELLK